MKGIFILNNAFLLASFVQTIVISALGLVLLIHNEWRRKVISYVERKFIYGRLNKYDIESYVIAKILTLNKAKKDR